MLYGIARVEVVFGAMPGGDIDVAAARRERNECVAKEFARSLAIRGGGTQFVVGALEDAAAAELLELKAVNGIGQRISDAVHPIADEVDGYNALSIARHPISAVGIKLPRAAKYRVRRATLLVVPICLLLRATAFAVGVVFWGS